MSFGADADASSERILRMRVMYCGGSLRTSSRVQKRRSPRYRKERMATAGC